MNGPLVNEGNAFDIHDGIFRVPVTGLYMFTVHALPMKDRPFMVQIHLNDQSVAAFSNGESGLYWGVCTNHVDRILGNFDPLSRKFY